MSHLIILSGNSLKNKAWGEQVLTHYGPWFTSACMLEYDHWVSGAPLIDFVVEEAKLKAHVATLAPSTEVVVFAKSAGSLLAFLAMYHQTLSPVRVVFFGIPFDMAAEGIFKDSWAPVKNLTAPALAFHNTDDPTTSYQFTKASIEAHAPQITLVTTGEADHWYGDVATYDPQIKAFLHPII